MVTKSTAERYARKVEELRKVPGHESDQCADCRTERSTWANVTYGVFLCMSCAGIHRKLATSRVMSLTLDDWSKEEYESMVKAGGNRAVNLALNPGNEPCPNSADFGRLEMFVRSKYETRKLQRSYLKMHQRRQAAQSVVSGGSSSTGSSTQAPPANEDSASVGLQPTWKATLQRDVPAQNQKQAPPQTQEPFFSLGAQGQPQQQAPQQSQPQVQYQMMPTYSQPAMSLPAYPSQQVQMMPQQPQMAFPPQPQMFMPQQQPTFASMPMQQQQPIMFMSQPAYSVQQPQMQMPYMQQPQQQYMAYPQPQPQSQQQFYVYQ